MSHRFADKRADHNIMYLKVSVWNWWKIYLKNTNVITFLSSTTTSVLCLLIVCEERWHGKIIQKESFNKPILSSINSNHTNYKWVTDLILLSFKTLTTQIILLFFDKDNILLMIFPLRNKHDEVHLTNILSSYENTAVLQKVINICDAVLYCFMIKSALLY